LHFILLVLCCAVLQVRYVPGRADSTVADHDDLLPAFTDDFFHSLFYFLNNGVCVCAA
jgi:hypothetical protein